MTEPPNVSYRRICLEHLNGIVKRRGFFFTWRTPVEVTRFHTQACNDFQRFLEWEEAHEKDSAKEFG